MSNWMYTKTPEICTALYGKVLSAIVLDSTGFNENDQGRNSLSWDCSNYKFFQFILIQGTWTVTQPVIPQAMCPTKNISIGNMILLVCGLQYALGSCKPIGYWFVVYNMLQAVASRQATGLYKKFQAVAAHVGQWVMQLEADRLVVMK